MNRMLDRWMQLGIIVGVAVGSSMLTMAADKVVVVPMGNSTKVAELEERVAELETLLAGVSRNGSNLVFSGVNVHVVDGSGDTDGSANGLGNLTIGYNELRGNGDNRSGSHNLIVGMHNNYSSYGGLVAGSWNTISGAYASVSGGHVNTASEEYTSVSGGDSNRASEIYSSVSGGYSNTASGSYSSVSGGYNRSATGNNDWVAGSLFENE